jgi:hypothetical protein
MAQHFLLTLWKKKRKSGKRITCWMVEHPKTSGLVENRMITQALSGNFNTNHDDWDWHLPAAVFAINTVQQSIVEISPFQLEYSRLPFTTLQNHFPLPKECPEPFEVFLARIGEFRKAARLNIVRKLEKSKRLVDFRRRIVRDFCPGELVRIKFKEKRFLPNYVGPFQVVMKISLTTSYFTAVNAKLIENLIL